MGVVKSSFGAMKTSVALDGLKAEFRDKLGRKLRTRHFWEFCGKELLHVFRSTARDQSHTRGRGVFEQIARSIDFSARKSIIELTVNHRAAHLKQEGGTVVAGQGPYSTGSSKYRSGRAKGIPVLVGRPVRSGISTNTADYGDLKPARPKAGSDPNLVGTLREPATAKVVFALFRKKYIPPHRKISGGTGFLPEQHEVYAALDLAAEKYIKEFVG